MRTWKRAEQEKPCGNCRARIVVGEAYVVFTLTRQVPIDGRAPLAAAERSEAWREEKTRCQRCAGEPAPELPPLEGKITISPSPLVRNGVQRLPFATAPREESAS